jgi:TonB family protein
VGSIPAGDKSRRRSHPKKNRFPISPMMKRCLRILFALSILQFVVITPVRATDIVTVYDKFKSDTTSAPDPEYPMKAKNLGFQGQGIYRLVVNQKTGIVDEVKVMKTTGHRELDASAVMTFFNWKFKPGVLNHRDVLVIFHLTGWTRGLH